MTRAICIDCGEGKHGACYGEALVEYESGEIAEVECWCAGASHMPSPEFPDAADKWVVINLVGGYVCSVCEDPVESEPCAIHQPNAYAEAQGELYLEPQASPRRASDVPLFDEEATS